jgi:uncharacterized membrane protein YbhN (UPF0104 family)
MTLRRALLLVASFTLSIFLIVLLVKITKIDIWATVRQVLAASRVSFLKLAVLTGLHIYLANEKWRAVDAVMRSPSDSVPPQSLSFALTSVGATLGQLLPVQLSMSVVRTLGTYFYGKALKRGTVGTLFEQSFDIVIVVFLAVASAATTLFNGGQLVWFVSATIMLALAMLSVGLLVQLANRIATSYSGNAALPTLGNAILRKFSEMQYSGLLRLGLARRLLVLSALRFVVQVFMAKQAAEAIGAHIALWQLAAALPFVVIACVIAITPGGLGVNEVTYATSLHLFGTPLSVGAQWAIANRFLVAASCSVIAICAAGIVLVKKIATSSGHDVMQEGQ